MSAQVSRSFRQWEDGLQMMAEKNDPFVLSVDADSLTINLGDNGWSVVDTCSAPIRPCTAHARRCPRTPAQQPER